VKKEKKKTIPRASVIVRYLFVPRRRNSVYRRGETSVRRLTRARVNTTRGNGSNSSVRNLSIDLELRRLRTRVDTMGWDGKVKSVLKKKKRVVVIRHESRPERNSIKTKSDTRTNPPLLLSNMYVYKCLRYNVK